MELATAEVQTLQEEMGLARDPAPIPTPPSPPDAPVVEPTIRADELSFSDDMVATVDDVSVGERTSDETLYDSDDEEAVALKVDVATLIDPSGEVKHADDPGDTSADTRSGGDVANENSAESLKFEDQQTATMAASGNEPAPDAKALLDAKANLVSGSASSSNGNAGSSILRRAAQMMFGSDDDHQHQEMDASAELHASDTEAPPTTKQAVTSEPSHASVVDDASSSDEDARYPLDANSSSSPPGGAEAIGFNGTRGETGGGVLRTLFKALGGEEQQEQQQPPQIDHAEPMASSSHPVSGHQLLDHPEVDIPTDSPSASLEDADDALVVADEPADGKGHVTTPIKEELKPLGQLQPESSLASAVPPDAAPDATALDETQQIEDAQLNNGTSATNGNHQSDPAVERRVPGASGASGGASGQDNIFKVLVQKIKGLELNQSLFDQYINELNQRYEATFDALEGSVESCRDETTSLTSRLAAIEKELDTASLALNDLQASAHSLRQGVKITLVVAAGLGIGCAGMRIRRTRLEHLVATPLGAPPG